MMGEKTIDTGKTTLNISLSFEDKVFLKVYAAQNGITISRVIQNYIHSLKSKPIEKTRQEGRA